MAPPPRLQVAGLVLERASGATVAGAVVTLDDSGALARSRTDEHGRFELALPPDTWHLGRSYRAMATLPGDQRIFHGPVVLRREMVLRTRTHLVLRGRLETNLDLTRRRAGVVARVRSPDTVDDACACAELDTNGCFAIEAWVDRVPDSFELTFETPFLPREDVPTAELLSASGATIVHLVAELAIRCEDEAGNAVPEARVLLVEESGGCSTSCDSDGVARFMLRNRTYDVCARASGHTPALARIAMSGQDRAETLVLRHLHDGESLTGTVLGPRGEPVAGAKVEAIYSMVSGQFVDGEQATTGTQGRFELPAGGDLSVRVAASEGRLGSTPEVIVEPGVREVTLRFQPRGALLVDLTRVPSHVDSRSFALEWVLVARETGRALSSHRRGEPFRINDLLEGEHDVYVFHREAGLLALGEATVHGGAEERVELPLEPAVFADGMLLRADGSAATGLNLRLVSTDLPDPVVERWGKASTDVQGGFRMLLGPSGEGTAVVPEPYTGELGRLDLLVGRRTYVIAP